jgi:hypothetical protein
VRRDGLLPNNQAEVVFSDLLVEQLEQLSAHDQQSVLSEIVGLCAAPGGKHPLRTPLQGWNTLDVLGGQRRVVYRVSIPNGVGLIEAICLGPRRNAEVYDMAAALVASQRLTEEEVTQFWVALSLLDIVAESVGLDGWDYQPNPAPAGLQRAAVAAGLLTDEIASLLSTDEIQAAMTKGWDVAGNPDAVAALSAALLRSRGRVPEPTTIIESVFENRRLDRCGATMPRAQIRCVRRIDHPGPHRSH